MTAPPSAAATISTIATLTFTRLVRGRVLWVALVIAALPIAFAFLFGSLNRPPQGILNDILRFEQAILVILPALLVASTIGEDIEDRTTTYLWSRPVERTVVLAGKLCTLIPIVIALVLASWWLALAIGPGRGATAASYAGLALGAGGLSLVAAAVATLVPKHAMALSVVYVMMFDLGIGNLPGTLANLSITYHLRVIADVVDTYRQSPSLSALGIGIIGAVWLAIALLRMRRLEA